MNCQFIETSAKGFWNVDEAFTAIVREIRSHNGVFTLSQIPLMYRLTIHVCIAGTADWSNGQQDKQ
jgi:hypothetical protein